VAYTVAQVLQIANVCQYLAADDEVKKDFTSNGFTRPGLSRLIYMVKNDVSWLNTYNPASSSLTGRYNYLFSLCQPYVGRALQIIGSSSSGIIVNPATGVFSTIQEVYLQFIVGTTTSPQLVNGVNVTLPSAGTNQIILPLSNILNQSIAVTKDGVPLPISATDRVSFTPIYTLSSVTVTLAPAGVNFQNGDLYVISGLQYVAL